ncbi:MAG TPA: lipoate--protein ligase family protein [Acidobacteriota bacterium]|nr:lipoate--protein ligase family protein [Acidobacteriota bacterium]
MSIVRSKTSLEPTAPEASGHRESRNPAGEWILILDRPRGGEENMLIDRRLLYDLESDPRPRSVLRLYAWKEPTISLGKHQRTELAVDAQACLQRGVPIVRRPTGGRAVLHADELTYAVLSNDRRLFPRQGVLDTYRAIARALQHGLALAGVDCVLSRAPAAAKRKEPAPSPARGRQAPCFTSPNRYELLVDGRKIAGSAQRRLRRAFLQHGSIPLSVDYALMGELLAASPAVLRASLVSAGRAAARPLDFRQLAEALAQAFKMVFPGCWRQRR